MPRSKRIAGSTSLPPCSVLSSRRLGCHSRAARISQGRSSFEGSRCCVRGIVRPAAVGGCVVAGVRFQTTRLVASDTFGGVTTGWSRQPRACEVRPVGGRRESNESTTA